MQSITVFFIHSAQSFIICYLFDAKFYCFLSIWHKALPFMWLQNYSVNNYLQCLVSSKGLMSDKHVTCPFLDVPPVGRRNSWARLSGFPYRSGFQSWGSTVMAFQADNLYNDEKTKLETVEPVPCELHHWNLIFLTNIYIWVINAPMQGIWRNMLFYMIT